MACTQDDRLQSNKPISNYQQIFNDLTYALELVDPNLLNRFLRSHDENEYELQADIIGELLSLEHDSIVLNAIKICLIREEITQDVLSLIKPLQDNENKEISNFATACVLKFSHLSTDKLNELSTATFDSDPESSLLLLLLGANERTPDRTFDILHAHLDIDKKSSTFVLALYTLCNFHSKYKQAPIRHELINTISSLLTSEDRDLVLTGITATEFIGTRFTYSFFLDNLAGILDERYDDEVRISAGEVLSKVLTCLIPNDQVYKKLKNAEQKAPENSKLKLILQPLVEGLS